MRELTEIYEVAVERNSVEAHMVPTCGNAGHRKQGDTLVSAIPYLRYQDWVKYSATPRGRVYVECIFGDWVKIYLAMPKGCVWVTYITGLGQDITAHA